VAVVTGSASGIGRALVDACESRGMHVFAADISSENPVDVSTRADVEAFARSVYEQTDNVDFVFNNAGVMPVGALVDTTDADWARVIGINLLGVMNVVSAFVPHLRGQPRRGHIVNTASLAGFAPPTGARAGAYAATKAAVVSVSESLAHELQPDGIGVSVVCPSGVATHIFEPERLPAEREASDHPTMSVPDGLMEPAIAARRILDGVLSGRFYVFTHTDDTVRHRLFGRWAAVEADFTAAAERGPTC
jgi:NAD(P)-dependent dehydrogenase (short-subunit alcohol dehydrogenase family)